MAQVTDPENRLWRVGSGESGNEIYALVYNDVTRPSRNDVLLGSMETPSLAEQIVNTHNQVLRKFGRHYKAALRLDSDE